MSESSECQKCTVIAFSLLGILQMWCFLTCQQVHEEHIAEALPWDRNLEVMRLVCPLADNCSPKSGLCGSTIWQEALMSLGSRSNPMWVVCDLAPQVVPLMNVQVVRYELWGSARLLSFAPLADPPSGRWCFQCVGFAEAFNPRAPTLLSFVHSCDRAKSPWMCVQRAAQYFQGSHCFPWAARTTACRLTWLPGRPKCDSWMMCQ